VESVKAGTAKHHFDTIAGELRLSHVDFGLHHLVYTETQVRHRDFVFDVIIDAVDTLKLEAGEVHDGFAHRLAGDGTGVDAGAAHNLAPLDDYDLTAALGSLNGGALARRPRADDNDVVCLHAVGQALRPAQTPSVPIYRR
jgi:hypothetical protein